VVFFNYTTMQASAKIVYYGPGLCGKTTNLQYIHAKTNPNSRGEMVSLETEADRTLFFDLLPLEVGTIGGMKVRLQLYTVPGQVFYNTTRKLVLKGVDGIVFVADSQVPAMDANLESLENLYQNLEELSQPIDKLPFVLQYNKRDLRNIHPVDALDRYINQKGYDVFEAAALHGLGVFETLKAISKKTLAAVHRRISGEGERSEPAVPTGRVRPTHAPSEPSVERPRSSISSTSMTMPLKPREEPAAVKKPRTSEVKVEFAASNTPSLPVQKGPRAPSPVSKITTKSRIDIERELEELRQIAHGKTPHSQKKASSVEVVAQGDYERSVRVVLPPNSLEKASQLLLDLQVLDLESRQKTAESLRVDLPARPADRKKRLKITIDLEEEE
jgi:hypothetical protein